MGTVICQTCGTRCLGDEPLSDCNNCNPQIRSLMRDWITHSERTMSEEEQIHEYGRVIDPEGFRPGTGMR